MFPFPYVGGTNQHPWWAGRQNATTLQAVGPTPPPPPRAFRSGEITFLEWGISSFSEAISEGRVNHGKHGHLGLMIVASAHDWRSFAARSSRGDHGGCTNCSLLAIRDLRSG
jgi:hypothetical protein